MATDEGTPEWTDTKADERNNDEDEDGVDDGNSGKGISSPKRRKKEKANKRVRQFDFCYCLETSSQHSHDNVVLHSHCQHTISSSKRKELVSFEKSKRIELVQITLRTPRLLSSE